LEKHKKEMEKMQIYSASRTGTQSIASPDRAHYRYNAQRPRPNQRDSDSTSDDSEDGLYGDPFTQNYQNYQISPMQHQYKMSPDGDRLIVPMHTNHAGHTTNYHHTNNVGLPYQYTPHSNMDDMDLMTSTNNSSLHCPMPVYADSEEMEYKQQTNTTHTNTTQSTLRNAPNHHEECLMLKGINGSAPTLVPLRSGSSKENVSISLSRNYHKNSDFDEYKMNANDALIEHSHTPDTEEEEQENKKNKLILSAKHKNIKKKKRNKVTEFRKYKHPKIQHVELPQIIQNEPPRIVNMVKHQSEISDVPTLPPERPQQQHRNTNTKQRRSASNTERTLSTLSKISAINSEEHLYEHRTELK